MAATSRSRATACTAFSTSVPYQVSVSGPGAFGIVLVADVVSLFELARHHARFWIGQATGARQRHEQRAALHVEAEFSIKRGPSFDAHAAVGRALEHMPEAKGCAVASAELLLEALDLGVGISVGVIELAPGATSAAKSETEIVDLPELATFFIIGGDSALERW